jgi:hypothetical protein
LDHEKAPAEEKAAPVGRPVAAKVTASFSASVAVAVKPTEPPTRTLCAAMVARTGAVFAVTVIGMLRLLLKTPSVALTMTV